MAKPTPKMTPPSPADIASPEAISNEMVGDAFDRVENASIRSDRLVPDAIIGAGESQALAIALLDASAHLRRVSTLSLAGIAAGLEKVLEGEIEIGKEALAATEASLDAATNRLLKLLSVAGRET